MADHSKPSLTSEYSAFVDEVKGRIEDVSKGFDPAVSAPTNLAAGAIRWTSEANKWQKWNGTVWSDLAATYAINISGTAASLATARTITLAQGATGSAEFDGAANITINVTGLDPSRLSAAVPINKGGTGATTQAAARTALGLGDAATRNVGATAGTVAAGNDPRLVGASQKGQNLDDLTNKPQALVNLGAAAVEHGHTWNQVSDKPSVYPSNWSLIDGIPTTATRWPFWGEISDRPTQFLPPMEADAVGSYAFVILGGNGISGSQSFGGNVAGSNLRPAFLHSPTGDPGDMVIGYLQPNALSGTWKVMGGQIGSTWSGKSIDARVSLAVRVA